jgi:sugar phosphate isomerase/epimerase
MAGWRLGVFTSLDEGLGIHFDVLEKLAISTIHLHAPSASKRSPAEAARMAEELRRMNVEVTVVFAGFEGESYTDIPTVERTVGLVPLNTRRERIAELKQIADFTAQMGVKAVGLHLGFVPHDSKSQEYDNIVTVARDICDYCAAKGLAVHLETGQEPAELLETFLTEVDRPNLHVNFDPANMILYGCGEPIPALKRLGPFVRSVHCKDATWSDKPGETWGKEMPLGAGDVNFADFLAALAEIRYTGPLTIEREIPQEPARQEQEIRHAVDLLNRLMQV